jgi:hypothetical protein
MSFANFQLADRRLTLLLALDAAAGYKANHFLLQRYCGSLGHSVSLDIVRADLSWLKEASLVTVDVQADVTVATLTERGADVANGRANVPGVARPAPGQD